MRFKEIIKLIEKRGDKVGEVLPANWIHLNGNFTPKELSIIAKTIEDNYNKVKSKK